MSDDQEPQPDDEMVDEPQEELIEEAENASGLICTFCGEENEPVSLKGPQHNRCWKCGHFVDFCDYIEPFDIKVGGSSRNPTGARKWFVWMARIFIVWVVVGLTMGLFNMINEMRSMPLK